MPASVSSAHSLKALCLREPHARPLTLAVAESMTGGRVQSAITAVAGASGFFLGGRSGVDTES
jgi:nicotinamide mononucleotide (NMN) deamidase PncC